MKEIVINSKKYGRQVVLVDDKNYEELSKYKWYINVGKHTLYAARDEFLGENHKPRKRVILMHRQILGLQHKDGQVGDHLDGNGMNNLETNLRICTVTENNRNQVHTIKGTSKYKGVWFKSSGKRRKRWVAEIRVDKKGIKLGIYLTEEEAAKEYDKAALKYFGEFACLNFPELKDEYLNAIGSK